MNAPYLTDADGAIVCARNTDEGLLTAVLVSAANRAEVKTTYGMDIDEVVSHELTADGIVVEFRDATQDADDDNMFLLIGPDGDVVDCGYE